MWLDNDTDRDFLNFVGVAEGVAELIVQAEGEPLSIGLSGSWGVGKTSLMNMIRIELGRRDPEPHKYVFVQFNAWQYQAYDDARAALIDVISDKLKKEAKTRQKAVKKVAQLVKRLDWLRIGKIGASAAAAVAFGVPPVGLIGELFEIAQKLAVGTKDEELPAEAEAAVERIGKLRGIVKPKKEPTPPQQIHAIRKNFGEVLEQMGVRLVVLIDDLDRCLPETTIATLEAIRQFLFLPNTAFIIAADDAMIRNAVKKHFGDDVEPSQATSYFDKLVQIPVRVPPLGTQEVRAYMMLLFVERAGFSTEQRDQIRVRVCKQLGSSWQGNRVDRTFMEALGKDLGVTYAPELLDRFGLAERLAPLMTKSSRIAGNPRLIKRFLNALTIRAAVAERHGIAVDEAVLAKLLLFERLGNGSAYQELVKAVTESPSGQPAFLAEWEQKADAGENFIPPANWKDEVMREWFSMPPRLAGKDLRGALYLAREHTPLISPEDRLTSEAAALLEALLSNPSVAGTQIDALKKLQSPDRAILMNKMLEKAQQENEWGTPPILEPVLAVAAVDQAQAGQLVAFLCKRPPAQVTASLVARIQNQPWSPEVFEVWSKSDVGDPVKKAIARATN